MKDGSKFQKTECQELICQISENNDRITKARELLMEASIDANDYKIIKKETEDRMVRLEATLNELSPQVLVLILHLLQINKELEQKKRSSNRSDRITKKASDFHRRLLSRTRKREYFEHLERFLLLIEPIIEDLEQKGFI